MKKPKPFCVVSDGASFDLNDRGLQYGDGFFTTMLVLDNKIANWSAHWSRLVDSAEQLGFTIAPESKVKNWLLSSFNESEQQFNVAKLIITRGVGGRGYQPLLDASPSYYLYLNNAPKAKSAQGGYAGLSNVKWGIQPLLAGVKHLNRLENVLAQRQLIGSNNLENVMLDIDGKVISGTSASICYIDGNDIISPKIVTAGIESSSLKLLAKMLEKQGKKIRFKSFDLAELKKAEEVFFCNAVKGIMPINNLADCSLSCEKSLQLAEQFLRYQYETLDD